MGLSASQSRLLTLTSRLSDLELKAQKIQHQKVRLAEQSTEASKNYMDALDAQSLLFNSAEMGKVDGTIENITASGMFRVCDSLGNYYFNASDDVTTSQSITTAVGNQLTIRSDGTLTYKSKNNTTTVEKTAANSTIKTTTSNGTIIADVTENSSGDQKDAYYVSSTRNILVSGTNALKYDYLTAEKNTYKKTVNNLTYGTSIDTTITPQNVTKTYTKSGKAIQYTVSNDNTMSFSHFDVSVTANGYTIKNDAGETFTFNSSNQNFSNKGSEEAPLGINEETFATTSSTLKITTNNNNDLIIQDLDNTVNTNNVTYVLSKDGKLSIAYQGSAVINNDAIPSFPTNGVVEDGTNRYLISDDGCICEGKAYNINATSGITFSEDLSTNKNGTCSLIENSISYEGITKEYTYDEFVGSDSFSYSVNQDNVLTFSDGFTVEEYVENGVTNYKITDTKTGEAYSVAKTNEATGETCITGSSYENDHQIMVAQNYQGTGLLIEYREGGKSNINSSTPGATNWYYINENDDGTKSLSVVRRCFYYRNSNGTGWQGCGDRQILKNDVIPSFNTSSSTFTDDDKRYLVQGNKIKDAADTSCIGDGIVVGLSDEISSDGRYYDEVDSWDSRSIYSHGSRVQYVKNEAEGADENDMALVVFNYGNNSYTAAKQNGVQIRDVSENGKTINDVQIYRDESGHITLVEKTAGMDEDNTITRTYKIDLDPDKKETKVNVDGSSETFCDLKTIKSGTWVKRSANDNSFVTIATKEQIESDAKDGNVNNMQNSKWLLEQLQSASLFIQKYNSEKGTWEDYSYISSSLFTTEDDDSKLARAEAEYEAKMAEIQHKDKSFDLELDNIETEHKAIENQLESVKGVVTKNIDKTFQVFS